MNALPRYNYPPPPDPTPRRMVRRRPRRNPHQAAIAETGFKLGVNCVLTVIAITTLVKLVPYNLAQQSKLQEIHAEVSELESRVRHLRADLNRQFDPQQAMSVMQEESIRVDPRQRQVIWLPPSSSTAQILPGMQPRHSDSTDPAFSDPAFYPPSILNVKP
jgi:cell division protein FtsB